MDAAVKPLVVAPSVALITLRLTARHHGKSMEGTSGTVLGFAGQHRAHAAKIRASPSGQANAPPCLLSRLREAKP